MISVSLLFSGNNFAKLELFSRFMNMPFEINQITTDITQIISSQLLRK